MSRAFQLTFTSVDFVGRPSRNRRIIRGRVSMNAMAAGQAGSERFIALEGLRGLAAVGVLLSHALFAVEPGIFKTMYPLAQAAWPEIGWPAQLLTLPPFSMLINGSFAVCVFFVLSGFVLTKSYADTGNASVLVSRAIRRIPRLGIPIAASIVFAGTIFAMGLMRNLEVAPLTGSIWLTWYYPSSITAATIAKEALYESLFLGKNKLNSPLWTMSIELVGSYLAFMFAFAARWFTFALVIVFAAALSFAIHIAYLPFALSFGVGVLLTRVSPAKWPHKAKIAILLAAIYLGGFSNDILYEPIIKLSPIDFNPLKDAMHCVGATFLVASVLALPSLQRAFSSYFFPLLGRLSFSVYLLHFPILCSLGCFVYLWTIQWGHATAASSTVLIVLVTTIIAAVPFQRLVDVKSMEIAKRVDQYLRGFLRKTAEA